MVPYWEVKEMLFDIFCLYEEKRLDSLFKRFYSGSFDVSCVRARDILDLECNAVEHILALNR